LDLILYFIFHSVFWLVVFLWSVEVLINETSQLETGVFLI